MSGVAFDPALLYVLIGGPDYLRFLVPERLVPFSYVGPDDALDRIRRRLVSSFAGMGVVDREGRPCPALEGLLAPIRDCGFAVADGVIPAVGDEGSDGGLDGEDDVDGPVETRSFAGYFGAGAGTFSCFARDQALRDEWIVNG